MANLWFISDTHFSHKNSWEKFKLEDGSPLRPFSSNEEMDETMVQRWNEVVRPNDHVYHLGDVVISKKAVQIVKRLNGHKRLVRGNHDIFSDDLYREVGFEKIYGVRVFVNKFILSHVPLHPDSVSERFRVNVHGHTHANRVLLPDGSIDPRYFSVCVEQIDYRPISEYDLLNRIQKQFDECGYEPPKSWGNGPSPN